MEVISIPKTYASSQTLLLEGSLFTVDLRWNSRAQAWSLDMYDGNGVLLAGGVRIVADAPLLERFGLRKDFPAGEILALDTSNAGEDPGFADFGTRVLFVYMTAAEVASA